MNMRTDRGNRPGCDDDQRQNHAARRGGEARFGTILAVTAAAVTLSASACGNDDSDNEAGATTEAVTTTLGPVGEGDGDASGDPTTVSCVAGAGGAAFVDIAESSFQPNELEITADAAVTFTNLDSIPHSVWSSMRIGAGHAFQSVGADPTGRQPDWLRQGEASTCTFPGAGRYQYLCGLHTSMTGTITVV